MKILYIVPYIPNLIRVRPYNLIRHLTKNGNEVTVAAVWSDPRELEDIERLRGECTRVIPVRLPTWRSMLNAAAALPQDVPLQSRYSWHPNLFKQIAAATGLANGHTAFDVIHVEHLRGAEYGLRLKGMNNGRSVREPAPVVWDSVDCISYLFRQAAKRGGSLKSRVLTALELNRTARYERRAVNQYDRVLVTSPLDRQELAIAAGGDQAAGKIEVLQNGVDLDYFSPDESEREPATIVVSGKMSYHANVAMVLHLVREIMPAVWFQKEEVKVWVVGKDPPPSIRALAEDARITVTGTVSDMRPYLRQATLAVVPITYGAGIQNKILEAMACGTPVVASVRATSALLAEPGRDMLVAESPEQFANAILRLLLAPTLRTQLGAAGRQYVEKYHDWDKIALQLERIYCITVEEQFGGTDD